MGKLRTILATAAGGLALTGCAEAEAENNEAPEKAEFTKLAAVVETTKVTREQCIALMPDKGEVKSCMLKLSAQNQAEIAALDEKIETEKEANEQRRTTNEVLRKRIEVAEKTLEDKIFGSE